MEYYKDYLGMSCEASEGNVNGLPLNLSECLVFES